MGALSESVRHLKRVFPIAISLHNIGSRIQQTAKGYVLHVLRI